jgi:lipopolysaccharide export system permease protein
MLKTSSAFYDYHMKNNFIFPKDVKYIRGELNESDKVLDFYSKKSKEIFFDKNYYDSLSKKLRLNSLTYTRALNSARNIKTNLSINAARIKSQEFEINKNENELIKKYAQAFACISMFLVGAPLGALIKRGGLGIPVIISILFYIIYYVLNILGLKWAREDLISPFLAAWMSNLLIFPLGVLLLYLARKDSRIFDYNIIESIKTKFLIFQKKQ